MTNNLIPVQEFLIHEITPEEFSTSLDAVFFECCMQTMRDKEVADSKVVEGLYYIHEFSTALKACK